jgi:hypothetical protein
VPSIAAVQPVHVATWIEAGTREFALPSVNQRLAALRPYSTGWSTVKSCWVNPAHLVRRAGLAIFVTS